MQESERWIWPFELLEKIGEGGMGVVYRARYVVNDKHFAVKLLPSDVTDETILARFQRELEILKKLKHQNIVRCFGGETKNKRQFYAMELVDGGTLEQLLASRGRLAWELVVEYGLQMCAALAYSHQHGIVHRDIKPGNFLLTNTGRLKLSDFGLASVIAARRITAEGRTMGTYQYMAPEQIRGKEITPQTDLYALGCVFFELLTGRPPFVGETAAEILHQHIKEPAPRVGQFAPDCPAGLEQLVFDLLQKEPSARPADAETVARRLGGVTQTITVKPNLRPFEQVATAPQAVEMKDTKSATVISHTSSERLVTVPRWIWLAGIAGVALLLVLIFSLLSQRSSAEKQAEDLWLQAFEDGDVPVKIVAAKALGQLAPTSEAASSLLLEALENPPQERTLMVAVVTAVGEAGYSAKSAVGTMQKIAQSHSESTVRTAAMAAGNKLKSAEPPGRSVWFYLNVLTLLSALGAAGWVHWKFPA
jgi:serine/threonine-protein kinase